MALDDAGRGSAPERGPLAEGSASGWFSQTSTAVSSQTNPSLLVKGLALDSPTDEPCWAAVRGPLEIPRWFQRPRGGRPNTIILHAEGMSAE